MGIEELRELLDLGAIEQVESSLRPTPRNVDELHDLLRRAGPLLDGEYDRGFAETLLRERRAIRARLEDAELLVAVEDAGLVRDAFGVVPPAACRRCSSSRSRTRSAPCCGATRRRKGRSRPPRSRRGSSSIRRASTTSSAALERDDELVRGELRPGGSEREWCDPDVLRRIRRATLAVLRHGGGAGRAGRIRTLPSRLARDRAACRVSARRSSRSRGCRCPRRSGRATCSRGACRRSGPRIWTCSAPPARWSGSAPASTASPSTSATTPRSSVRRSRRRLRRATSRSRFARRSPSARSSGPTSSTRPALSAEDVLTALWELVWAGEVTNDSWAPLRASRRYELPRPRSRGTALRSDTPDDGVTDAGPLVARVDAVRRDRPIGGRSQSSCSSARASSRATAFAARGSGAGTARCTRS